MAKQGVALMTKQLADLAGDMVTDSITFHIELPADATVEDVHVAASEVALRASDLCKALGGHGLIFDSATKRCLGQPCTLAIPEARATLAAIDAFDATHTPAPK